MYRRVASTITLLLFLNCLIGCTAGLRVPAEGVPDYQSERISKVFMLSGNEVEFNRTGARFNPEKHAIIGVTKVRQSDFGWQSGEYLEIGVDSVSHVEVRQFSSCKTAIFCGGVLVCAAAAAAVAVAIGMGTMD